MVGIQCLYLIDTMAVKNYSALRSEFVAVNRFCKIALYVNTIKKIRP